MPILEIRGLTKRFGGLPALDDVSLDVEDGEIVAVIGPNGAGKSTLLHVINGTLAPSSVRGIHFLGQDLAGLRPHQIRHAGIATVLQAPRGFGALTVEANVALGAMFGPGGRRAGEPEARDAARRALDLVGFEGEPTATLDQLTTHQLRRVDFARAVAGRPRLVLLDEMMAGLHPVEVEDFGEVIGRVRAELGLTILWVEHVMPAIGELADRAVVMVAGRVLADGRPREILRDPRVISAYLGRRSAGSGDAGA